MSKFLSPKSARLIPTVESRRFHQLRNDNFTPDKFQEYNDWFYFIHVDPCLRWIHAIGMMIGLILYFYSGFEFWIFGFTPGVVIKFLSGAFFFYFLPLISHHIYDGGSAKSTPDKFHSTLIPVIHINLLTLSGQYDKWLRKFILKYPFTVEAWQLEEREK
jgi:hypothetical protein